MWILINLLFLSVALVFLLVVFVAVWSAFVLVLPIGRRPRARIIAMASAVPVFVLLVSGYVWYGTWPSVIFRDTFGFTPPSDVKDLQSERWALGDSGHVYLRFRASPLTVQRIVARGMTQSPALASIDMAMDNTPAWWKVPAPAGYPLILYERSSGNQGFASEHEILVYDPARGEAFFAMQGVN